MRLMALVAVGVSSMVSAQDDQADIPSPETPAVFSDPAAFEARVVAAGGRVDFVFGDDRPFQQCHASTIVGAGKDELICAWFGGTEEKDPDVGVWHSRFRRGEWVAPTRLAKVNETAHWNPVLFRDKDGDIHAFFKVGPEIPEWQTYWMTNKNDGRDWSEPVELVLGDHGGRGPVKNKPIVLSDGSWLAGASSENQGWKPFADRSTNRGVTWTRTGDFPLDTATVPGRGAIQPTLWESKPGYVHALMRTSMGKVVRSDSENGGATWSAVYATELPNNNSGVDVLKLDDGTLWLVLNPIARNWGPRTPLTLARSTDNGHTWEYIAHLETAEGEYSYPAIARTEDGVAISYTWRRERVRVWQIPFEALP